MRLSISRRRKPSTSSQRTRPRPSKRRRASGGGSERPVGSAQQADAAVEKKEEQPAKEKKKSCLCSATMLYLPNMFRKLSEAFSVQAGAGPVWAKRFTMTKWAQFGLDYGDNYFLASPCP